MPDTGTSAGTAYVGILPSFKHFSQELAKGLQSSGAGFQKFGKKLDSLGTKLTTRLSLPLAGLGAIAFEAASDLNEQISKVNVVFGKSADSIQDWSKTTINALGLSRTHALEAAGTFGNLFVSLKLGEKPAAEMSKRFVGLAADLASFNNVPIAEALDALRSGLVGEVEPLRRFGVNLNDASLRQKALELGLVKTTKEVLPPAIKAQASYALILEQTTTAQGDYARTADSAANKQRRVSEQFNEAAAAIGQRLLPIGQKLLDFASKLLDKFTKLSPGTQDLILKLGLVGIAMGPVLKIAGNLSRAVGGLIKAFGRLTATKATELAAMKKNAAVLDTNTAATGALGKGTKKLPPIFGLTAKSAGTLAAVYALGTVSSERLGKSAKELKERFHSNAEVIRREILPAYEAGKQKASDFTVLLKRLALEGDKGSIALIKNAIALKDGAEAAEKLVGPIEKTVKGFKEQTKAADGSKTALAGVSTTTQQVVESFAGLTSIELEAWRKDSIDAISGLNDVLQELAGRSKVTTKNVLKAFGDQLDAIQDYRHDWERLVARGLPDDLAKQLQEMGVQGNKVVSALANLNEHEFNKIIAKWKQSQSEANRTSQAFEDIPRVLNIIRDIKKVTPEVVTELSGLINSKKVSFGQVKDAIFDLKNLSPTIRKNLIAKLTAELKASASVRVTILSPTQFEARLVRGGTQHEGGPIPGFGDVPILAEGGEFMIQKSAVKALGLPFLRMLNEISNFNAGQQLKMLAGSTSLIRAKPIPQQFHSGGLVPSRDPVRASETWNVVINNPRAEPSSQSLPAARKRLQLMTER